MSIAAKAWVWYLIGAFLTLGWKFLVTTRTDMRKNGWTFWQAVVEYFLEDSNDNRVSWFVTVAIVWTGGAIFIDLRGSNGIFAFMDTVPLHNALAFLLGGSMEMIAPPAARNLFAWILSKLPGGGS